MKNIEKFENELNSKKNLELTKETIPNNYMDEYYFQGRFYNLLED